MVASRNASSRERENIERMLGRPLGESERGSITSLNDLTETVIAEARRLPWPLAHLFLSHYLQPQARSLVPQFVDQVVFGSVPAATWLRGRILAPDFSVQELVSLDVRSMLEVLGPRKDDTWRRIKPDRRSWEEGETWMGAPVLLRPDLDYRYTAGPHVLDFAQDYPFELEDVSDVSVATRRWMTSRFAAIAWQCGSLGNAISPDQLLSTLRLEGKEPSEDALVACRALVAEQKQKPLEETAVPGFRGPDNWYSGLEI